LRFRRKLSNLIQEDTSPFGQPQSGLNLAGGRQ
jgi:hypothetical protein